MAKNPARTARACVHSPIKKPTETGHTWQVMVVIARVHSHILEPESLHRAIVEVRCRLTRQTEQAVRLHCPPSEHVAVFACTIQCQFEVRTAMHMEDDTGKYDGSALHTGFRKHYEVQPQLMHAQTHTYI